jgi:hypothetical protein
MTLMPSNDGAVGDRDDCRLGLEFDDPKMKPRAQALLPPHEPTGARFERRDRIADRVPAIDVGLLPLDRVVCLFGRHTHGRWHASSS